VTAIASPPRPLAATHEIEQGTRQFKLLLAGLIVSLFLSALDNTIVATAMPTIVGDLGGFKRYTWATTAYVVTSTISTLILGKLSDLYGRRRVYLATIIFFILASMLCGLAQSMNQLIGYRALQGIGGGGIWSLTFAIIGDVLPPRERGRYFGLFTGVFAFASLAGPLLGGVIVGNLSWRWIFYVNLPIGLLAVFMVTRTLHLPRVKRLVKLDIAGAGLVSAAICALMVALETGQDRGWGSTFVIGLFAAALLFTVAFVAWERKATEPIQPPRLFTNDIVRMSLLFGFLLGSVLMTAGLFYSLYFQNAQLASPTASGMRTLPMMIGLTLASTFTGRYITKSGSYKRTPLIGIPLSAFGMALGGLTMLRADPTQTTTTLLLGLGLFCTGAGTGMTMPTASISVQNSADPRDLGIATSSGNFFRNLGSAIGLALFGTLFNSVVKSELEKNLPASAQTTDVFTIIRTPKKIAALPAETRDAVTSAIATGAGRVLLVSLGVMVLTFISALLLREEPLRTTNSPNAAPPTE
jgi:EmrB/QacA subfamily drug resistance transporter